MNIMHNRLMTLTHLAYKLHELVDSKFDENTINTSDVDGGYIMYYNLSPIKTITVGVKGNPINFVIMMGDDADNYSKKTVRESTLRVSIPILSKCDKLYVQCSPSEFEILLSFDVLSESDDEIFYRTLNKSDLYNNIINVNKLLSSESKFSTLYKVIYPSNINDDLLYTKYIDVLQKCINGYEFKSITGKMLKYE